MLSCVDDLGLKRTDGTANEWLSAEFADGGNKVRNRL